MIRTISMVAVAALLAAGCSSLDVEETMPRTEYDAAAVPADGQVTLLGVEIQTLIKAHTGLRMEFFDKDGTSVAEMPADGGSVSIYNDEETGQNNYSFAANGIITKHLRSHGDDYTAGVWKEMN